MVKKPKAPFPYFGGKSRVAPLVWAKFGDVDNYIEPFAGSAAMLLGRPHAPRIETVNDADCMVANFWRATQHAPDEVAEWADGPVNEADLHARHRWLVLSDEAKEFRRRMRSEPEYFDPKIAGWWCWGLCCWIGGGWCAGKSEREDPTEWAQMPRLSEGGNGVCVTSPDLPDGKRVKLSGSSPGSVNNGSGVHAAGPQSKKRLSPNRKPRIDGGEGQYGHGVHAKGQAEKIPRLTGGRKGHEYYGGLGVHTDEVEPALDQKRPRAHRENGNNKGGDLPGVHNRPQLADAFSRGRGVNGNDAAGTCEQRRLWLCEWFGRLRDRLRTVRVCCGDWRRVCDSESVTTRLGTTGIFFDPPYGFAAGRDMNLYAVDCGNVANDVRAYCLERGPDPMYRIALCGYAGEGHDELESAGWDVVAWKAQGGYGNRSAKGKANADKERIWFSPHCGRESSLFAQTESPKCP